MIRFKRLLAVLVGSCLLCSNVGSLLPADAAGDATDADYYAPTARDIYKYSGWPALTVEEREEGGVHVSFENCNDIDIRTAARTAYQLDGLHVALENFTGDGVGIVLSNKATSDARNDAALRFVAVAGGTSIHPNGYLASVYSIWAGGRNLKTVDGFSRALGSTLDLRMDCQADGSWLFSVNGQGFAVPAEDVEACVPDTSNVYIQFIQQPYGSTGVKTSSFDVAAIHDGRVLCLDSVTEEQWLQVAEAEDLIAAIGTVDDSAACGQRIQAAKTAYDALDIRLREFVSTYEVLKTAMFRYQLLTQEAEFDENHIALTFGAVSDIHIGGGGSIEKFTTAVKILQERAGGKMDTLVIAGDISDHYTQYENAYLSDEAKAEIIQARELMDEHLVDGTEVFYCLGNHDSQEIKMIGQGPQGGVYYDIFRQSGHFYQYDVDQQAIPLGNRHAVINGIHFVAVESNYTFPVGYDADTLEWADNTLAAITAEQPDKPVIVVTHPAAYNTIFNSDTVHGRTGLADVLKKYPQAILITGHTHITTNDERNIWQGEFTAVNDGGVHYMSHPSGFVETGNSSFLPNSGKYGQGLLFEIDVKGNTRITRLDFAEDEVIKEPWIIPAPKDDGSHLLYYTDARAEVGNTAPAFPAETKGTAELLSSGKLKLAFDTATDDDMVYAYRIGLYAEDSEMPSLQFESLSGFWKYARAEDWPAIHEVTLQGITLEAPYRIEVRAVDSWGLESDPLTITFAGVTDADRRLAWEIEEQIAALPDPAMLADRPAVEAARAAYDRLNFIQRTAVNNRAQLLRAERDIRSFYTYVDEVFYASTTADTVGTNYWPERLAVTAIDGGGTHWQWTNAEATIRMGLKPAIKLDGAHLRFANLEVQSEAAVLSILISNTQQAEYGSSSLLLCLNLTRGTLTAYPHDGGTVLLTDDSLKADHLKDTVWDVWFEAADGGSYCVHIGEVEAVIYADILARAKGLTDPDQCYITLSAWSAGCTMGLDLLSFHSGEKTCYHAQNLLDSEYETALAVVKKIGRIPDSITLSDERLIAEVEAAYEQLSDTQKLFVLQAGRLSSARAALEELKSEIKPEEPKPNPPTEQYNRRGVLVLTLMAVGLLTACQMRPSKRRRDKSEKWAER